MAGEIDVYQPCLCGSGRKLKFCCQPIIGDMARIIELEESRQFPAALTLLESTEKKLKPRDQWSRAWVKSMQAFMKLGMDDQAGAQQFIDDVLKELPEHPLACGVNAILALLQDGNPSAMRAVYRAFQFGDKADPLLLSQVAMLVYKQMMLRESFLGAARFLMLAIALNPESTMVKSEWQAFMASLSIFSPLREVYEFREPPEDDPLFADHVQAKTLVSQHRYSEAAKAFGGIARKNPKNADVWWNIALCHSYAGEDPLAAQAFNAAAANEPRFEVAVDCLVLSRLLKPRSEANRVPQLRQEFEVSAVSRLLSAFDQDPLLARWQREDSADEEAVIYRVLDRAPVPLDSAEFSLENGARIIGEIAVFDSASSEDVPVAIIHASGREHFDRCTRILENATGEPLKATEELRDSTSLSLEHGKLCVYLYVPDETRRTVGKKFMDEDLRRKIEVDWVNTPHEGLQGKTPAEAAQIPALKAHLAAAVIVVELELESNRCQFDLSNVRRMLGIAPVEMDEPISDPKKVRSSNVLTYLGLRHYPVDKLPDELVLAAIGRFDQEFGSPSTSMRLLEATANRWHAESRPEASRLFVALAQFYLRAADVDNAAKFFAKAKEAATASRLPLIELAFIEYQELYLRLEIENHPEVPEFADRLWNYYGRKIPAIREQIAKDLQKAGIPGPWNASSVSVLEGGSAAPLAGEATGLWTPESASSSPAQKLWLPGQ